LRYISKVDGFPRGQALTVDEMPVNSGCKVHLFESILIIKNYDRAWSGELFEVT